MKAMRICLWIINLSVLIKAANGFQSSAPEDANLNFTELATKYGHPAKEYEVITEDGYILTLFHLPGGRRTPILLMHGTGDHADSFILRGKRSLGITLADADYDIWVGSLRGNKYARRHIKLNADTDPEFWDFSFHEAGYYDLPATIDYVLNATGENKVKVIGHSQGTTINFVLLSLKPEYNEKLKLLIALAPVAFLTNVPPPVSTLCKIGPLLDRFLKINGLEELSVETLPVPRFNKLKCGGDVNSQMMCTLLAVFYSIFFDPRTIEPEFFQVLLGHYPGRTSRKTLVHYNQVCLNKTFSNYDYGDKENVERYGGIVPPKYDLRKVTVKTALFVGRRDLLATVRDADTLTTLLPNVVLYHKMEPKMWNHIDFIWRNDMDVYMIPAIIKLLRKYD